MPTLKTRAIRLLLVDDHEVVRVGLRTLLSEHPEFKIIGEACTMNEAVHQAVRLRPDVVLMDARLPDGSGVEACRKIIDVCPDSRVIFLTSYADDDSILAAVVAGAQGYVLKEIDSNALIGAIQAVSEGQSILDPIVTQKALTWIRGFGSGRKTGTGTEPLSPQEERVLALVAEGKTNKEIAAALRLSDKTVKNYLANMFQKLHITRRTQAAAFFIKRQS